MLNALILCAKRGVDIRVVTPGIPDKKIVFQITRSFYSQLIEGGVKIIEYTPGFVHSKVFVCDDVIATVGTVNLDYRSLYLHFENGTYLYGSKKVLDIKQDFMDVFPKCKQIKAEDVKSGLIGTFLIAVLRLFAPLM
jgi:cardiolipin synthase